MASPAQTPFKLPELYEFPPFFTLQPVDASRARQQHEWKQLLVSWAAAHKASTISVATWPLWQNDRIQRRLSPEGIAAVVEHCIAAGAAEWADPGRSTLRVFSRSPAEWGSLVHEYCVRLGYTGQVLTLYELHSGAAGLGTAWAGLDGHTLLRAMETLEAKGKAVIMRAEDVDETAVKLSG